MNGYFSQASKGQKDSLHSQKRKMFRQLTQSIQKKLNKKSVTFLICSNSPVTLKIIQGHQT